MKHKNLTMKNTNGTKERHEKSRVSGRFSSIIDRTHSRDRLSRETEPRNLMFKAFLSPQYGH